MSEVYEDFKKWVAEVLGIFMLEIDFGRLSYHVTFWTMGAVALLFLVMNSGWLASMAINDSLFSQHVNDGLRSVTAGELGEDFLHHYKLFEDAGEDVTDRASDGGDDDGDLQGGAGGLDEHAEKKKKKKKKEKKKETPTKKKKKKTTTTTTTTTSDSVENGTTPRDVAESDSTPLLVLASTPGGEGGGEPQEREGEERDDVDDDDDGDQKKAPGKDDDEQRRVPMKRDRWLSLSRKRFLQVARKAQRIAVYAEIRDRSWWRLSFTVISNALFLVVTQHFVSALDCTYDGQPRRKTQFAPRTHYAHPYLDSDPEIQCWHGIHLLYAIVGCLGLLIFTPVCILGPSFAMTDADGKFFIDALDFRWSGASLILDKIGGVTLVLFRTLTGDRWNWVAALWLIIGYGVMFVHSMRVPNEQICSIRFAVVTKRMLYGMTSLAGVAVLIEYARVPWLAIGIQFVGSIIVACVVIARELVCVLVAKKKSGGGGGGGGGLPTTDHLAAWFTHVVATSSDDPLQLAPSSEEETANGGGQSNPLWKSKGERDVQEAK